MRNFFFICEIILSSSIKLSYTFIHLLLRISCTYRIFVFLLLKYL